MATPSPLIVIVGETASGKSALALEMARRYDAEIICADSRTVYRGLDIGTAKPTKAEQAEIPHHLIDVVNPDERFSAAEFQRLATKAIKDINTRSKLPIMVGGTGLYVDAVLYDFTFLPKPDPLVRAHLSELDAQTLQAMILERGLALPANAENPRHLIRVLETNGQEAKRRPLRPNTLILGLAPERAVLRERIQRRAEKMFTEGILEELMLVVKKYGTDCPGLQATTYRPLLEYLAGSCSLEEAKAKLVKNDLQLAKRQRTWFKRNNGIHWLSDPREYVAITTTFLNTNTT